MNDKRNVLLLYLLDKQIPLCTNNSRSQVTFSAGKYLRLCWREGLVGWNRCFKHFLEYTYFSKLVKVIIRILQPFLCFFFQYNLFIYFLTSWIFIPFLVFSLLRYSLLVTRYCVVVFSNTRGAISPQSINQRLYLTSNLAELLISLKNINL